MQVSQLEIQYKSAAPARMGIIFLSSLVDTIVGLEPSVRMTDMSKFLGQKNRLACFFSARALNS